MNLVTQVLGLHRPKIILSCSQGLTIRNLIIEVSFLVQIQIIKERLETAGVTFTPGLSDIELKEIENKYHFCFPPDLKEFLKFSLPVSKGFLNWRDAAEKEITERLQWPYDGMCFDIKNNSFWLREWGERPFSDEDACKIARKFIDSAPVLIPIFGHRYIPDRPNERGNPIVSVYQADIIYYGCNLFDYLENEFFRTFEESEYAIGTSYKTCNRIEFWSDIIEN
jgi:hypothetical protein